jgi:serine phosphatase RsbU (regulator of sigma subunit)/AmiR/NasT family two-component response regulator
MNKKRVLLFEDNQTDLHLIQRLLRDRSYLHVRCESTTDQALEQVIQYRPDIILMDIYFEGGTEGISVAKRIKEKYEVPIIFLTAAEDEDALTAAQTINPYGFIHKPIRKLDLYSNIDNALHRYQAEKRLELNRHQYREFFIHSMIGMFLLDIKSGKLIDCNQGCAELFGYDSIQTCLQSFSIQACIPSNLPLRDMLRNIIYNRKASFTDVPIHCPTGMHIWVDCFCQLSLDNRCLEGAVVDISPHKTLQQELHRYNELLEQQVKERTKELMKRNSQLQKEISDRILIEQKLRNRERELSSRNRVFETEMEHAEIMQASLLPVEKPTFDPIILEYRYLPYDSVGGDFFSFTSFAEGGFGIFLGDVAGHGISAALFLSLVRSLTNKICRRYGQDPQAYIEHLNQDLIKGMPNSFLTGIYAYLNKVNGGVRFQFAKGGHPPPVLYRKNKDTIELLNTKGAILGCLDDISIEKKQYSLESGDRLFFYTDGIPEAKDTENRLLGFADSFLSIFHDSIHLSLDQSLDYILEQVNAFHRDQRLDDDIVLIGIEIR